MSTDDRPGLLFLSPVMPAAGGNGLAMRAGVSLRSLASRFRVRLLVIPVVGPRHPRPSRLARRHATDLSVLPLDGYLDPHFDVIRRLANDKDRAAALRTYPRPVPCRFAVADAQRAVEAHWLTEDTRYVHVMRLYLSPYAAPILARSDPNRPKLVLDLDDDDHRTHLRLGALHRLNGEEADAERAEAEADKYARLASDYLDRFDRVLVCSALDRGSLTRHLSAERVAIVPNAAPDLKSANDTPRLGIGPLRSAPILFVGTLGYAPNVDAARFFCEEVLPLVRARVPGARVALVGRGASEPVRRLGRLAGVQFVGAVGDLRPYYARAQVVVVPVRAGGGTRIKILEAFAQRRPVVTTTVGMEGLEARPEEHVIVADTAQAFAAACARLLEEPQLAAGLAERAAALAAERYSFGVAAELMGLAYRGL